MFSRRWIACCVRPTAPRVQIGGPHPFHRIPLRCYGSALESDVAQLIDRVQHDVVDASSPDQNVIFDAIKATSRLQAALKEQTMSKATESGKLSASLDRVLMTLLDKAKLTDKSVHGFMVSQPPPLAVTSEEVLKAFNVQNPVSMLTESTLMIPYRRAVYTGNFADGLRLGDLSAGWNSNADAVGDKKLKKVVVIWSAGVAAIIAGVDRLLSSGLVGHWESHTMVLAMVMTYLCAISVYSVMAMSGSKSGAGETLAWLKGTSMLYRYKHALEMKMARLATDMNRHLPENQGEPSNHMRAELKSRKMEAIETKDEEMVKEYWARGGEGFEWVEPDQDPADIIWQTKMNLSKHERIGSPFVRQISGGNGASWAHDVAEMQPREIPHASLINMKELRTPEKMKELEDEINSLKRQDQDRSADSLPPGSDKKALPRGKKYKNKNV